MNRARRMARFKRGLIFIATNYTGAFIIVITISILTCLVTINYLSTLETDVTDIFENEIQSQDYIQIAYNNLLIIESAVKDIIIYPDGSATEQSLETIRQSTADLKKAVGNATPSFYTPAGKEILAQSKKDMNNFIAFLGGVTNQLRDDPSLDRALLDQLKAKKDRVQADFKRLIANKTANSSNGFRDIITQLRVSLLITILIVIISIGIRISMYLAQRHKAAMDARKAAEKITD